MKPLRLLVAVAAALFAPTAHAGQAPPAAPGVQLTLAAEPVDPGEAIALSVVVQNDTDAACLVAAPSFGLALALLGPDGGEIAPAQSLAYFPDGLRHAIDSTSVEVPAGGSASLALAALPDPAAEGAAAFRTFGGVDDGSAVLNRWRFRDEGAYQLSATLRAPRIAGLSGPRCAEGATASTPIVVPEPSSGASGFVALAMCAVLAGVRRPRPCGSSRGRRARSTLVMVVALSIAAGGRPAEAGLEVAPPLQPAFDACVDSFRNCPGVDSSFLDILEGSEVDYRIEPSTTGSSNFSSGGFLYWEPEQSAPLSDGTAPDACATLLHELTHGREQDEAGGVPNDTSSCFVNGEDTGIPRTEVEATQAENAYREAKGLPVRTGYGGNPLPPPGSECEEPPPPEPPPPPAECTGRCGRSNGDPHFSTFDGLDYDFQAVGEFVLVASTVDDLEIQTRQRPWGAILKRVSVNTALGARVAGTEVAIEARGGAGPLTVVDGVEVELPEGTTSFDGGGEIERSGELLVLRWPDGTALTVTRRIGAILDIHLSLAETRAGQVVGLMGDADGDPANDLRTRAGEEIGLPPFSREELYDLYGESWRISDAESLLLYAAGQDTGSFTDRSFPSGLVSAADLPGTEAAEALCRQSGVVLPEHLADCVLDVAATGEVGFATGAAEAQAFVGDVTFPARLGDTLANAVAAEARHVHVFDAVAGTPIELVSSSGTVAGASWRLLAPEGSTLAGPVPLADDLGGVVLPSTGSYRVAVDAEGFGAAYVLDLLTAAPQSLETLSIGGSASGALLPGERATWEFRVRGTAFVYPNSRTASPDSRRWRIESPSGRVVVEAGLSQDLGRLELAEGGFYRVVVEDPEETGGDFAFDLIAAGSDVVQDLAVVPGSSGGSLPPAGRLILRFPVEAGTTLTFVTDVVATGGRRWRLEAADGTALVPSRGLWVDLGPVTVTAEDTYSLIIDAIDESGGSFSFSTVVE